MNHVQNPVDYIRAQRAYARQAKNAISHGIHNHSEDSLQEIRRFHVLAAWTTRQYYRSANTPVPRLALAV